MVLTDNFKKYQAHLIKVDNLKKKREQIELDIKELEAKKGDSWIDALVHPLAEALKKSTGAKKWEVYGPYGLASETIIYVYIDEGENEITKCLTVVPDFHYSDPKTNNTNPWGFRVKDFKKKTGSFPPGSVGARNGGNFASYVPPVHADIEWFINLLTKD